MIKYYGDEKDPITLIFKVSAIEGSKVSSHVERHVIQKLKDGKQVLR